MWSALAVLGHPLRIPLCVQSFQLPSPLICPTPTPFSLLSVAAVPTEPNWLLPAGPLDSGIPGSRPLAPGRTLGIPVQIRCLNLPNP